MKLSILIAGLIFGAAAFGADSGAELFQKAVTQERAAGNLEEAIKLYQRVATEFASDRALAAKALVQEARCYEKLGKDKAVKLYEQVARDYRDQREPVATANARLAALKQPEHAPAPPATITQRRLEWPNPDNSTFALYETDGQRRVSWDNAAGALVMTDLTSGSKRVIFKPKDRVVTSLVMSRDFSLVLMNLTGPGKTETFGVVKTDGTGYREIGEHRGGTWGCSPEISWDNRSILLCQKHPDGPTQLVRVSVADGEIHKMGEAIGSAYRFSPDGRFIFYNVGSPKTFIMPSEGGEPQLISDEATPCMPFDWTRDGRFLIVDSPSPGGSDAISLLPVKDGRRAGDPILVRYGSFLSGRTTSTGAFIYHATPQDGQYTPWLGKMDASGHTVAWERLSLKGSSSGPHFPTWSPDSTQFAYVASDSAAGQFAAGILRVRNILSNEDRELYRDPNMAPFCFWSAKASSLVCVHGFSPEKAEAVSISTETGRAQRLAEFPRPEEGSSAPLFLSHDDHSLYALSTKGLIRWEVGAAGWTMVTEAPNLMRDQFTAIASPDGRWITRRKDGKVEIRPITGGDWRPLISIASPNQMAFTADGNWLLYHDRDAAGKDGLFRVATTGGDPERLGDFPAVSVRGWMWISPDGQKIVADAFNPQEIWMLENFEPRK